MATLAPLRAKRPEITKSAVPWKSKCNVQHRSDLLMNEHMNNVRNSQEALKVAIASLERAKSEAEVERWTAIATELKERTDQLVLTLQVMNKLNIELAYARADLSEALYQHRGDINTARKRVIWLEDRMGKLYGKTHYKSPCAEHTNQKVDLLLDNTEESPQGRNIYVQSDPSFKTNENLENQFSLQESSESCAAGHQNFPNCEVLDKQDENSPDLESPFGNDNQQFQYTMQPVATPESFHRRQEEKHLSRGEDEKSQRDESEDSEDENEWTENEQTQSENDDDWEEGKTLEIEEETNKEDIKDEKEKEKDNHKTFVTELADKLEFSKDNLHVKSESYKKKQASQTEDHDDLAASYWESEHHRFEYGDSSGMFGQMDPLSYNCIGLAVPGSFLKQSNTDFTDLPWKTHLKSVDIKDIHREALDKLAVKVHNMQDKIYSATMLSVHHGPGPDENSSGPSLIQNIDNKFKDTHTQISIPRKNKSMSVSGKKKETVVTSSALKVTRPSTTASGPKHLVFYPKPIPSPQVLPITRTNYSKEFPQFASSFAYPDPDQRIPAERIVDQRNLIEETKLVLYRSKPQSNTPGLHSMELRFKKMLEQDDPTIQKPRKTLQARFKVVAAVSNLHSAVSHWNEIKPQSRGKEYSGLRWERVKTIVHHNLVSERVEERIDAAKQLGMLRCGDTMVVFALKGRLHKDPEERVCYEATKSLVLIGCWEDEILRMVLKYLVLGNTEIRQDLISTLINGKNVQHVDKTIPSFLELVKVLSHFCCNPDPDDQIAFDSAVLMGHLGVQDVRAETRLLKALKESSDTHIKAKALEILVMQLKRVDALMVSHILQQLARSPVWRYRVQATRLLITIGATQKSVEEKHEEIYELLQRRLWDDPNNEVRVSAAKALTALGMFTRACETVENHLEDLDEKIRAEAIISVGTLGMKNERIIRLLLEMLELDPSEYVRLMIIRTFAVLKLLDRRVLRTLREREKFDGPLSRESKKTLQVLDSATQSPVPKSVLSLGSSPIPFIMHKA